MDEDLIDEVSDQTASMSLLKRRIFEDSSLRWSWLLTIVLTVSPLRHVTSPSGGRTIAPKHEEGGMGSGFFHSIVQMAIAKVVAVAKMAHS